MQAKDFIDIAKETFQEWREDKASRLAAALAYYTIFSIPPLLLIALAIAGQFFGTEAARAEIRNQIGQLAGSTASDAIGQILENASRPEGGLIATVVGVIVLLFGASGVFAQLQDAMNTIWEVAPRPDRGIMATIVDRFLSFTMVLGIGFLLLVSLVISAVLSLLEGFLTGLVPGGAVTIMWIVNLAVSLGIITLLFAPIFKVIPDVEIEWSDVWVGALVTAVLFTVGKEAIGWYMGSRAPASTYGAAGSLVVILLWVYYSAQILFLGAEFTQVYANRHGSRIVPDEDAVRLTTGARLEQGMPRQESLERRQAEQQTTPAGPQTREIAYVPVPAQTRTTIPEPPTRLKEGMEAFHTSMVTGAATVVGLWRWLMGAGREIENGGETTMPESRGETTMPESQGRTIIAWFDDIETVQAAVAELTAGQGFTREDIDMVPGGEDAVKIATTHDLEDYEEGFLLGVRALGDLDQKAIAILSRHNPLGVVERPFDWRDQGIEGFELEPSADEVEIVDKTRQLYREKLGEQYDVSREE